MALLADISATLDIDVEVYHQGNLLNNFVEPATKIKSIDWSKNALGKQFHRFNYENDDFVVIPDKELDKICYPYGIITIISGDVKQTFVQEGDGLTIINLLDFVLDVERESRHKSEWFGGIDAHHVYFEGLYPVKNKDHTYKVSWGS